MGGVGLGAYLSLIEMAIRWGGRLVEAGRLFEVSANSRLGAYLKKYGTKSILSGTVKFVSVRSS